MIDALDETLRRFLIQELPVQNGEIDIKFDQPKREWSARLSRPTLNLFLYDVAENRKLRQTQHPIWEITRHDDGTVSHRRRPVRVDLRYMVTAWATEAEDEHRLLSRAIFAFLRHPHLPPNLLEGDLEDQPFPIAIEVIQTEELRNPADLWSAMDNELRPVVTCVFTLSLNPYSEFRTPLVRSRELTVGQANVPLRQLVEEAAPSTLWTVGGQVFSETQSLQEITLTLVERGSRIHLDAEGRFAIGNLRAGEYTLELTANGKSRRQKITVPSPDYTLEI